MAEKNNDKKKVWIYAVILFTSAFVVLLLTAVSQIKLNKNISDYKTQIFTTEKEKSGFQLNLSSSINENKKLQEQLNEAKEALDSETKAKEDEINNKNELEETMKKTIESYEKLMKAEEEFLKNNYVSCAVILSKQLDSRNLNEEGKKRYLSLKQNTYEKAAKTLYFEGLKKYKEGSYTSAVSDFRLSTDLVTNEYYSDDCYYYIAYSLYNAGKYDLSENAINELIKNYPASSYVDDAYDLLKLVKK